VKEVEATPLGSGSETLFFFANLGFCGLRTGYKGNLQIWDLHISHYKFADWHTSEICGFAIE
jgi:hypothetical protein